MIERFYIILAWLAIALVACNHSEPTSPYGFYVSMAFDSIEHYSLNTHRINLDSLERSVLLTIADTTPKSAIHDKLEAALRAVDKHSYVLHKDIWNGMAEGRDLQLLGNPFPFQGKILKGSYAFVALDGFAGVDSAAADNYTDSLQNLLRHLYSQDPRGWIIDLRNNTGGWSPAMFAGLGPILGEGIKAYSIAKNDPPLEHFYAKNDTEYITLSDSVWTLAAQLPVAVLIGDNAASAGELLALAFRGNPKTVLIGEPTYGVSTDLKPVVMPDSFRLVIANSRMTDRNRVGNGGPIQPEIPTRHALEAFEKAYEWIDKGEDSM